MTETLRGREITSALLAQEGANLILRYHENQERAERAGHRVLQADLGILTARGPNLAETLPQSFDVNLEGPVLLARDAADRMKARGTPGAIVFLGTMQAAVVSCLNRTIMSLDSCRLWMEV